MLRVRGIGAHHAYDETLRAVRAGGHGSFEWTMHGCGPHHAPAAAVDLLRIGRAVHLADRLVRRGYPLSNQLRTLRVDVEISQPARWRKVTGLLEELLEFATGGDAWTLRFHAGARDALLPAAATSRSTSRPTTVALFSGGLDSLCGAAYQASRKDSRPLFVTHSPPGRLATCGLVGDTFRAFGRGDDEFTCVSYRLEPREAGRTGDRSMFQEPTRRTRPFFYLALACATAIAHEVPRVQMSENGALALSLPYRFDVHGPSMARQAHSFLLAGFEALLRAIVPDVDWVVTNPFVDETKGEACLHLGPSSMLAARSASCEYLGRQRAMILAWRRRHPRRKTVLGDGPQCGLCVPCLVRRAALRRAGIADPDSAYFASAPQVLRRVHRWDRATEGFGSAPPPLMNVLTPNVVFMERHCDMVRRMSFEEFVVRYLPELRANRQLTDAPRMDLLRQHALMRRYAREMLTFLHG